MKYMGSNVLKQLKPIQLSITLQNLQKAIVSNESWSVSVESLVLFNESPILCERPIFYW